MVGDCRDRSFPREAIRRSAGVTSLTSRSPCESPTKPKSSMSIGCSVSGWMRMRPPSEPSMRGVVRERSVTASTSWLPLSSCSSCVVWLLSSGVVREQPFHRCRGSVGYRFLRDHSQSELLRLYFRLSLSSYYQANLIGHTALIPGDRRCVAAGVTGMIGSVLGSGADWKHRPLML